jgi:hypothetical protein
MIEHFYPNPANKRYKPHYKAGGQPPFIPLPPPNKTFANTSDFSAFIVGAAAMKNITPAEWARRDGIIKAASNKCTFTKDSFVYPQLYSEYEKYGGCRVVGITSSYRDWNEKEWPIDDEPYIVVAMSIKPGHGTILAQWNYFGYLKPEPPFNVDQPAQ